MRQATGYTQETAAEILDIGLRMLQSYEEGERHPNFVIAVKMAKLYGCSLDTLAEEIWKSQENTALPVKEKQNWLLS